MSKCSFFILLLSIGISLIPLYLKFDSIKNLIEGKQTDENFEDKKKYILSNVNKTMEKEFKEKYINLKKDLNNYLENNTYLKYESIFIDKLIIF